MGGEEEGSTLALSYAQAHPSMVLSLVLRGVFSSSARMRWTHLFCSGGTFGPNPAALGFFLLKYIEDTSTDWARKETNVLGAYWTRVKSDDRATREAAAAAFVGYERSISKTFFF